MRFDDRSVDFASGRKMSPPLLDRRTCDCCGQRIVKGYIRANGDTVGDDCATIIDRAEMSKHSSTPIGHALDFAVDYKRATGWRLKAAVVRYLSHNVYVG